MIDAMLLAKEMADDGIGFRYNPEDGKLIASPGERAKAYAERIKPLKMQLIRLMFEMSKSEASNVAYQSILHISRVVDGMEFHPYELPEVRSIIDRVQRAYRKEEWKTYLLTQVELIQKVEAIAGAEDKTPFKIKLQVPA